MSHLELVNGVPVVGADSPTSAHARTRSPVKKAAGHSAAASSPASHAAAHASHAAHAASHAGEGLGPTSHVILAPPLDYSFQEIKEMSGE